MAKIGMPTIYIKHKGIFNLSEIIQGIKSFLEGDSFKMHFPKHKIKKDEHEIKIYGERKMNEYVKFTIKLLIRIFDWKEVEIIKDGEKVKADSGRIAIDLDGVLELDYQGRFGGSKFMQGLQDFYHKYIIHRDIGDYWEDELMMRIVNLGKLIRGQCQHEALT